MLDEATSHVDAATEAILLEGLRELECTQFVIAHRLSSVRDCDRIVVIHEGSVEEIGTHFELMKLRGVYARLFGSQVGAET